MFFLLSGEYFRCARGQDLVRARMRAAYREHW